MICEKYSRSRTYSKKFKQNLLVYDVSQFFFDGKQFLNNLVLTISDTQEVSNEKGNQIGKRFELVYM